MQRSHGLPDERSRDTGWRKGAGDTMYMQVHLDVETTPTDKSGQSIYIDSRGGVHRPVRVGAGEEIIDPLDHDRLR
jgi:hypothetical protein